MIIEEGHWKWYARKIDKLRQHDRAIQLQSQNNQKKISYLLRRQEDIMKLHEHNKMMIEYYTKKKKEAKCNGNLCTRHGDV